MMGWYSTVLICEILTFSLLLRESCTHSISHLLFCAIHWYPMFVLPIPHPHTHPPSWSALLPWNRPNPHISNDISKLCCSSRRGPQWRIARRCGHDHLPPFLAWFRWWILSAYLSRLLLTSAEGLKFEILLSQSCRELIFLLAICLFGLSVRFPCLCVGVLLTFGSVDWGNLVTGLVLL